MRSIALEKNRQDRSDVAKIVRARCTASRQKREAEKPGASASAPPVCSRYRSNVEGIDVEHRRHIEPAIADADIEQPAMALAGVDLVSLRQFHCFGRTGRPGGKEDAAGIARTQGDGRPLTPSRSAGW